MTRTRRTAWAVALIGILLLAACSTGDPSGTQAGGGTRDVTGSESGGGGSTSSVDGMPVPLAPGADAVSTGTSGPLTTVLYVVPLDQQAATIAFYDQWTDAEPDEYLRTEAGSGGVTWQNAPDADEDKIVIQVLSPLEGDDFVSVSLAVGPAE